MLASLPRALLEHVLYPMLRSCAVAHLAQTCRALYAARNFTTAIEDAATAWSLGMPPRNDLFAWWKQCTQDLLNGDVLLGSYDPTSLYGCVDKLIASVPHAQLRREIECHR